MTDSSELKKQMAPTRTITQSAAPNLDRLITRTRRNILCIGGSVNGQVMRSKAELTAEVKQVKLGGSEERYKLACCGFHRSNVELHIWVGHQHENNKDLLWSVFWLSGGLQWLNDFSCPEA